MCEHCFQQGIRNFPTYKDYSRFEGILHGKVMRGELTPEPIPAAEGVNIRAATASYRCLQCGERWLLSEPDNAWRGYFLTNEALADPGALHSRQNRKRRIGCFILAIVLFGVVLLLIFSR